MSDDEKIKQLMNKMKEKDEEDYQHSLRVGDYVSKMLENLSIADEEKVFIKNAALLHDIGILEISDNILKKTTRLNFDEYEEIKHHTELSDGIIKDLDCYENIKLIIKHHHENFNGFGYPDGLEGEEIPLGSRIIHIAEAYDTMVQGRKSRQHVFSKEMALREINEFKGRIYDPSIVDVFLKLMVKPKD